MKNIAVKNIADNFPALRQTVNGHTLVYLDSAATSMRPESVLRAVDNFYRRDGANPHRGMYDMAQRATDAYDGARVTAARFVGADAEETVFVRNASEGLNLIALCYAPLVLGRGDNIVLPITEHHSNLVPWQILARRHGAELRYMYVDPRTGVLPDSELDAKIDGRTKIVAFTHVSNVLGTRLPVEKFVAAAKAVGAITVLDCAQSVPHFGVDLHKLGVDFAAFSGHKMYAPMGIGVMYGRRELLEAMPPFLYGGDMIEDVREQDTDFLPPPSKFEAGTQNAGGAVGLAAAVEYITSVGWEAIEGNERKLMKKLTEGLSSLKNVSLVGNSGADVGRYGVASFNVAGVHPHDAATILNDYGVAVRAGKHCAHPLLARLDAEFGACCRASLGIYSTEADVDRLLETLPLVRRRMNLGD